MTNKNYNKKYTDKIVVTEWMEIRGLERVVDRNKRSINPPTKEIYFAINIEHGMRLIRRYVKHTGSSAKSVLELNPLAFVAFLLELKPTLSINVWKNYKRFAKTVMSVIPDSDWTQAIEYLKTEELPATDASIDKLPSDREATLKK